MKIMDILNKDCIIPELRSKNKKEVLEELTGALLNCKANLDKEALVAVLLERERLGSTGIGDGIAIPHIRSLQAKEFMIAFARSTGGYDFESLDQKPTHLFFVMAAPPYDDTLYLKVFKTLAEMLRVESFREELMSINSPGEVIRAIRSME